MAEERTKSNKELELLRKKNENLEKLCRGMQAQGRGTLSSNNTNGSDTKVSTGTQRSGTANPAIKVANGTANPPQHGNPSAHGTHYKSPSSLDNTESEYDAYDEDVDEEFEGSYEDEEYPDEYDVSDDGYTSALQEHTEALAHLHAQAKHVSEQVQAHAKLAQQAQAGQQQQQSLQAQQRQQQQAGQPSAFGGLPGQKPLPSFAGSTGTTGAGTASSGKSAQKGSAAPIAPSSAAGQTAGSQNWTTEQLITSTVHQAWLLSGKNEATFFEMVTQLAEISAKNRELTLPETAAAGRRVGEMIKVAAKQDTDQLLYAVVDAAVRKVGRPGTQVSNTK